MQKKFVPEATRFTFLPIVHFLLAAHSSLAHCDGLFLIKVDWGYLCSLILSIIVTLSCCSLFTKDPHDRVSFVL